GDGDGAGGERVGAGVRRDRIVGEADSGGADGAVGHHRAGHRERAGGGGGPSIGGHGSEREQRREASGGEQTSGMDMAIGHGFPPGFGSQIIGRALPRQAEDYRTLTRWRRDES